MYEKIHHIDLIKSNLEIVDYLMSKGVKPATINKGYALFHAPYRIDRNPSCIVNRTKNTFYDMATGQRGDIIQLVMLINNCTFKEAINTLNNNTPIPAIHPNKNHSSDKLSEVQISRVRDIESWVLKKYILSRGISSEVAKKYCSEVHYNINGNRYYAIGFKNDKGGFELRNAFYKGCSNKDISTIIENPENNDIIIFEGFFDFLSYKQLYGNKGCNALVLNSVGMLKRAIQKLKQLDVKQVYMCVDNDTTGEKVYTSINEIYGDKTIDLSAVYKNHNCKDLNEYLAMTKKLRHHL